jgi:uncharacterized coiled-coil protein SlyX
VTQVTPSLDARVLQLKDMVQQQEEVIQSLCKLVTRHEIPSLDTDVVKDYLEYLNMKHLQEQLDA